MGRMTTLKRMILDVLGREWTPGLRSGAGSGAGAGAGDKAERSGRQGSSGFGGAGLGGWGWDPWQNGNPAAENITGIKVNVRWAHLTNQRDWTTNDQFYLALLEAMQKDGHLSGLMEQRRRAVLSRDRWVATDEETDEGQMIQDMVEWALDGVEGFDMDLDQMMDAMPMGFSVMEVIWGTRRAETDRENDENNDASRRDAEARRKETEGKGEGDDKNKKRLTQRRRDAEKSTAENDDDKGENGLGLGLRSGGGGEWLVPVELKQRYPGRFRFNAEGGLEMMVDSLKSVPVPPFKFLVTTFDKQYENPYGNGLAFRCLWLSWFKKHGLKWWLIFNERFGAPAPLGKYPQGATKEQKDALLDVVKSFYQDTGVIIPEDMVVELIEAKRTAGTTSTYKDLCDWLDDQMSKMIIGSTLTSGEGRRSGSLALGNVHARVAGEKIEQDGRLLAATVNELVGWICALNFGDVSTRPYWVVDTQTEEDLKQWVEIATSLVKLGLPVPVDWFYKKFKIPTPGADERTLRFDDQNMYQYHMQYGVLKINEVRAMLGLEPVEWGEVPANILQTQAKPAVDEQGRPLTPGKAKIEEIDGKVEEGEELVESIVEEAAGEFAEIVRGRKGEAGVVAMREELKDLIRWGLAVKKKERTSKLKAKTDNAKVKMNGVGHGNDASRRDAEAQRTATAENGKGKGNGNGEKIVEHGGHGEHGDVRFSEVEELAALGRDVQIVDMIGSAMVLEVGEGMRAGWKALRERMDKMDRMDRMDEGLKRPGREIVVHVTETIGKAQSEIERVFGLAVMAGWAVGRGGAFREKERQMNIEHRTSNDEGRRATATAGAGNGQRATDNVQQFAEGDEWTVEGALSWLQGRELMTVAEFGALVQTLRAAGLAEGEAQRQARDRALTFAKAASEEAAKLMRDGIERAISEGLTVGEFIDGTLAGLEEAGLDKVTSAYLENVFRTNAMGAYNEAQEQVWRETWDDLWGFSWWNPVDARSRATHAALSGFRAPKEDGRWAQIGTPPLDYQCRCLKRAIYNVSANAEIMTTVEPRVDIGLVERF